MSYLKLILFIVLFLKINLSISEEELKDLNLDKDDFIKCGFQNEKDISSTSTN